jgi:hypothetical protein
MKQYEREVVLAAFLDLTAEQINDWIGSQTQDDVKAWPDGVNDHFGQYASNMLALAFEGPTEGDPQLMLQAVCAMADETLLFITTAVAGKSPLQSDCPFYPHGSREDRPKWAQIDCEGPMVPTSGLCTAHHNAQPRD